MAAQGVPDPSVSIPPGTVEAVAGSARLGGPPAGTAR
jgi:hypothetical protein